VFRAIPNAAQLIVLSVIGKVGVIGLHPAVFKFDLNTAKLSLHLLVVVPLVPRLLSTIRKPLAALLIVLLRSGVLGHFVNLVSMMVKKLVSEPVLVQSSFSLLALAATVPLIVN
jgi:hypothetical protein